MVASVSATFLPFVDARLDKHDARFARIEPLRCENIRLDPPVALGLVEDDDDQQAEEQRFAASEGGRLVQVTDASFKPSGSDVGPDPTLPDEEPDPTVFEQPPEDDQ